MSRALSRTMKLPNTEKPFQCNVCDKQVRFEVFPQSRQMTMSFYYFRFFPRVVDDDVMFCLCSLTTFYFASFCSFVN
jgi:hypothetical protein